MIAAGARMDDGNAHLCNKSRLGDFGVVPVNARHHSHIVGVPGGSRHEESNVEAVSSKW